MRSGLHFLRAETVHTGRRNFCRADLNRTKEAYHFVQHPPPTNIAQSQLSGGSRAAMKLFLVRHGETVDNVAGL